MRIVNGGFGAAAPLYGAAAMGPELKQNAMVIFHFFSWQSFLVWAVLLTLFWYVLVGALFFRGEIRHLFSGRPLFSGKVSGKVFSGKLAVVREEEPENLLGASKDPEGFASVPMNQFSFARGGAAVGQALEEDRQEAQLALVPDLLEELKTVFYTLERNGGGREDFEELFRLLAARFEPLITSPSYGAVNAYILEQLPFELSLAELEAMWEG